MEHGFRVPNLTPLASSESFSNTIPVLSSNPSIYEMANEFLEQNFPLMALESSGNPIVVSNEDWFDESMI